MMAKHYAAALAASTILLSGPAFADRLPGTNTVLGQGLCNPSPNKSLKICTNGVRNNELAEVPQFTIKGKNTSGTGAVLDLTYAQILAALELGASDSPTHAGLTITGASVNFSGLATGTLVECAGFDAASNRMVRNTCPSGGGGGVSFANPTATIGIAAVNGSASTAMRSDAAPAMPAASTSTAGIAKLHNAPVSVGWIATVNPNKAVIATVHQASRISAIIGRVSDAAGGAATVTVKKAQSGTACSGGTALHSGTFDANGTANTNQTLTLVGGATDDLADGDTLCLVTTGTTSWTAGTGIGGVTVYLAPL